MESLSFWSRYRNIRTAASSRERGASRRKGPAVRACGDTGGKGPAQRAGKRGILRQVRKGGFRPRGRAVHAPEGGDKSAPRHGEVRPSAGLLRFHPALLCGLFQGVRAPVCLGSAALRRPGGQQSRRQQSGNILCNVMLHKNRRSLSAHKQK